MDEAEISVKGNATGRQAWPLAYVAVQVFVTSPEVHELFRGMMFRACPYLIPDYAGSEVSREGPLPGHRGEEAYADYLDRMVGYLRVWFAQLVISEDLGAVWCWFARTLNQPPSPIAVTLIHSALELTANAAQARYRRQFEKLME